MAATLRGIRLGLDTAIILFGIVIIILCGIEIQQFPGNIYRSNGDYAMGALGGPAALMIVFCIFDIALLSIGVRTGIHRKSAIIFLIITLIGILAAQIAAIVVRALSHDQNNGTGIGLSQYADGDELFWPSWAIAMVSWFCQLALFITIKNHPKEQSKPVGDKKLDSSAV